MLLAVQIDNKNEAEQKTAISKQMDSGRINLKSLLPGMKNCELAISENGKAILDVYKRQAYNEYRHTLFPLKNRRIAEG